MKEERRKKTVAVLFGGCSPEYGVSLQSAYAVITHMNPEKYNTVLIGIDAGSGQWYLYRGDADRIPEDKWREEDLCTPVTVSMDRTEHSLCYMEEGRLKKIALDAALPVLHGRNGEDGTVQGVFELAGVRVVGCGLLCSALCMDKEMAHRIVSAAGIRTARSFTAEKPYRETELLSKAEKLGYPLFVKPLRAGSSFGVSRVKEPLALPDAVREAFQYDSEILLEEAVPGFEVGCAVLGSQTLITGAVDEIELSQGFFDYTEKYTLKTSAIHCPARIPEETAGHIQEAARKIYRALGCRDFARVDMFLTPEGRIVFNEVNTIPGFTSHSRYPSMMKAAGIGFSELLTRMIELEVPQQ